MRVTQGTFSFLPDLTDEQIRAQIEYALSRGWALSVEYTDDPHPRNTYWEMWGKPMFDLKDAAGVLAEVQACRHAFPNHYIEGQRVRLDPRLGDGAAVLHRQPADRGAGLRAGAAGGGGAQRPLHGAQLRRPAAFRAAVLDSKAQRPTSAEDAARDHSLSACGSGREHKRRSQKCAFSAVSRVSAAALLR